MITKVKQTTANGTWDSDKFGTFFKFEYLMENGALINALHKSKDAAFKPGDDVEVTDIKEGKNGMSGKVQRPKEVTATHAKADVSADVWRKKDIAIIYQNAFSQANTFYNVVGYNGKTADQSLNVLMATADIIARFVIEKSGI
jgi:hypothetical protein